MPYHYTYNIYRIHYVISYAFTYQCMYDVYTYGHHIVYTYITRKLCYTVREDKYLRYLMHNDSLLRYFVKVKCKYYTTAHVLGPPSITDVRKTLQTTTAIIFFIVFEILIVLSQTKQKYYILSSITDIYI